MSAHVDRVRTLLARGDVEEAKSAQRRRVVAAAARARRQGGDLTPAQRAELAEAKAALDLAER